MVICSNPTAPTWPALWSALVGRLRQRTDPPPGPGRAGRDRAPERLSSDLGH